jgi:hypothetical protein
VVGAAFDRLQVGSLGLVHQFSLAMRVRLAAAEKSVAFEVKVVPPGNHPFDMAISGTAQVNSEARPVEGNAGVVSVLNVGVPILDVGRYVVQVHIEGALVRELPFEVDLVSAEG